MTWQIITLLFGYVQTKSRPGLIQPQHHDGCSEWKVKCRCWAFIILHYETHAGFYMWNWSFSQDALMPPSPRLDDDDITRTRTSTRCMGAMPKFPPTAPPSVSKQIELSNFCLAGWLKGCRCCWLPWPVLVIEELSLTLLDLLSAAVSLSSHFGKISANVWSCNLKFMQAICQEIT